MANTRFIEYPAPLPVHAAHWAPECTPPLVSTLNHRDVNDTYSRTYTSCSRAGVTVSRFSHTVVRPMTTGPRFGFKPKRLVGRTRAAVGNAGASRHGLLEFSAVTKRTE